MVRFQLFFKLFPFTPNVKLNSSNSIFQIWSMALVGTVIKSHLDLNHMYEGVKKRKCEKRQEVIV